MVFESYLRAIVSISALDKNTVQVVALENTCRHREYCCAAARTEMEKAVFFIIFKTSEKKSVINYTFWRVRTVFWRVRFVGACFPERKHKL